MRSSDLVNESETVGNKRMVIDIIRMTVHNGPGIRTVIFFKGCPLRCVWCSTPELQEKSPEIAFYPERCIGCGDCVDVCHVNAIEPDEKVIRIDRVLCDECGDCAGVCYSGALRLLGKQYTVNELVSEVKKDEVVYKHSGGGVTLSGGEPLLEPEFTLDLLRSLKQSGINTGVDTCGFIPRKNIEAILPYVDFFLWDLKHMDEKKHIEYTGVSNRIILDNLRFVSEKGIPVYIRLPVIPGYNDSEENIRAVCAFAGDLPSLVEIDLLPLHHLGRARYEALDREYPVDGIPLIEDNILKNMKNVVESFGIKCNIIG